MAYHSWRDIARPIIAEVIRGCGYPKGCDLAFIRKALRGTYPFGERRYWPYKVWCDEVRKQLKLQLHKHQDDERQGRLPL